MSGRGTVITPMGPEESPGKGCEVWFLMLFKILFLLYTIFHDFVFKYFFAIIFVLSYWFTESHNFQPSCILWEVLHTFSLASPQYTCISLLFHISKIAVEISSKVCLHFNAEKQRSSHKNSLFIFANRIGI